MGKCVVQPLASEGESPFAVGNYTGAGPNSVTVTLGFRPRALFIIRTANHLQQVGGNWESIDLAVSLDGSTFSVSGATISVNNTGFTVFTKNGQNDWNISKVVYCYIAFR